MLRICRCVKKAIISIIFIDVQQNLPVGHSCNCRDPFTAYCGFPADMDFAQNLDASQHERNRQLREAFLKLGQLRSAISPDNDKNA